MRETSLEDFLGGSSDEQSDPAAGEDDESRNRDDSSDEMAKPEEGDEATDETVEPATATYAWTSDGADCADCETTVERRWLDGDRLVCADCKSW